jgi:hypothetical protein
VRGDNKYSNCRSSTNGYQGSTITRAAPSLMPPRIQSDAARLNP